MSVLKQPLKVALVQLSTTADKAANISNALSKISVAAKAGAKLVVLPECWNSPYAVSAFPDYAETIPGPTTDALAAAAKSNSVFLVGGSIPEKEGSRFYNTSITFNPAGELLAKHRKIHLFDIDVPNKIRFVESEVLSPGDSETLIDLDGYGKVGLGICYDIRFPELAMRASRKGAFAMIYPGAFNTTTGPLHWELLARSRAVDNQLFVILDSPARNLDSSYHAYGHSMAVNPWGRVLCEAQENENIVYAELDPTEMDEVRSSIPVSKQRRFDLYPDVSR